MCRSKMRKIGLGLVLVLFYFLGTAVSVNGDSATEHKGVWITQWEISRAFDANRLDRETYPHFYVIFMSKWHSAGADESGLVDIEKTIPQDKVTAGTPVIFGRWVFQSDKKETITFFLEYVGETSVFFNGHKVTKGPDHEVKVTTEKSLNEIFLMVTKKEKDGGWQFKCKTDRSLLPPTTDYTRLTKVWETDSVFLTPESVLYDEKRDVLYVTSFDNRFNPANHEEKFFTGYISKVKVTGEIENLKWITNLNAPCGMCIYKDHLYTVERGFLTEIDIDAGKIVSRFKIDGSEFLNDIAVDKNGYIYISDTSSSAPLNSRIYRFRDGHVELWEGGNGIYRANGLCVYEGGLLIGNSGDGFLKSISLVDKKMSPVISLGAGIIDGIRVDHKGNFLVSHWEGLTYQISPAGKVVKIMDTLKDGINTADFEFIQEKKLLIVPTFMGNKVVAYKLN